MHSPLAATSVLSTPCPKAQRLTGVEALMAAACKWLIPTGVTHGVLGCSVAFRIPLAKAILDLALVSHASGGEERKKLQAWQTALAPNLSQLLLTNPTVPYFTEPCAQQGQCPGLPQGEIISCALRMRKPRHREAASLLRSHTGSQPQPQQWCFQTHPLKHASPCILFKSGTASDTHGAPLVGCHLPLSPIYSSI